MPLEKCQSDPRFRSTAESCHNSEFRVPGHCYFGVPTKPSVFPVRVDVESDNFAKIIKPVDRGRGDHVPGNRAFRANYRSVRKPSPHHMAKANSGSQTRRVHTMIFFRDGSTRKNNFPHDSVERYHIEIGAPIDSPVTPIAWPRAAATCLNRPPRQSPSYSRRQSSSAPSPTRPAAPTASY
jgi:hypothetical protein